MREVKFQAWDKWEKEMLPVAGINFTNGFMWINELIDDETPANTRYLDEVVLRQYTGLKDKNGTEIYEGDIVRFNDFGSELSGGNVGDTIRTCFVEYIISGFFLEDVIDEEYEEDLGMALINGDEFEVIGNIFEHSHLLEGEK